MNVFQALVLGIIQGLAEFLPISSSAHLSLAPFLFGWQDPGLAFDVALHLGTLAAVLWYFRKEWIALTMAGVEIVMTQRVEGEEQRRAVHIIIASIPGGIAGLLLQNYAETIFRAPIVTAIALIVLGVLLWAADRFAPQTRELKDFRWTDALLIGIAQVLALIPGVSRSGSTMTAGRALGFDRTGAATFSFLMSMPITAAAAVVKVPEALREGVTMPIVVGILASGISGWLAISVLLKYVSSKSFGVFAIYRLVLGAVVLAIIYTRAG
ncbi:MAG TPA: undecaprenyl-diphosphatase UppP [Gemmatimonadaceae bacterium]|nr:undecaprenyl-diphosphatase UppP [Gemmatimonadaceae bacterium]